MQRYDLGQIYRIEWITDQGGDQVTTGRVVGACGSTLRLRVNGEVQRIEHTSIIRACRAVAR